MLLILEGLASPERCGVALGPPCWLPGHAAHLRFPLHPLSPGSPDVRPATPGSESPCPRCGKEARRLQALHEAVLSIREAQQELHR